MSPAMALNRQLLMDGVPQGIVLGPLLFLVYINNLPNCVLSSCNLFVDNCLFYRPINIIMLKMMIGFYKMHRRMG